MTSRLATVAAAILLSAASTAAFARQGGPAYAYAGSHAGGPANGLISNGTPRALAHRFVAPAYAYAGSHAGGPANGLISNGRPRAVALRVVAPAYAYAGSHAGGPANGLAR